MKVLVLDVALWSPRRLFSRGYVVVESGRVRAVGEGDPEPEHQVADVIVGGPGRVALPAPLAPLLVPEAFRDRWRLVDLGLEAALDRLRGLSGEESYAASLMAFTELAYLGVAGGVFLAARPASVARALSESGLWGVIVPYACGLPRDRVVQLYRELASRLEAGRVEAGTLTCPDGSDTRIAAREAGVEPRAHLALSNGLRVEAGGRSVSLGLDERLVAAALLALPASWQLMNRFANPYAEEARRVMLRELHVVLEGAEPLEPGAPANLVVVNVEEPPLLPVYEPEELVDAVASTCPRVETLISRGNIVVDGGQHMYVGAESASRARKTLGGGEAGQA